MAKETILLRSRLPESSTINLYKSNLFRFPFFLVTLFAVFLSGCASMGPGSIGRDRIDYDHSITESWQRQLLLNLVKLRYGDTPFFLDVASITNSYGLETQVSLTASWWADVVGAGASNSQSIGGAGRYSDKPTITYNPLLGNRFTRSLMTPISPGVVVSLIQSGWAADAVLRMMVTSINGVQNRFGGGARARGADLEFYRLCSLLRRIQSSGAVGMRVDRANDKESTVMTLAKGTLTPEIAQDRQTVREILGLRQDLDEVRIVFGSAPRDDGEIAMVTRSMLEMLYDLSASIDVPPSHVEEGRTFGTKVFDTDGPDGYRPMIRVLNGSKRPGDAFVAIPYNGYWFWVENRDYPSKQIFSSLLIILSLTDVDTGKGSPIITIPAN
jgi:hypothetical protein